MALPTGKQYPESINSHTGTYSVYSPEGGGQHPNRLDYFGESIHERHQENFEKFLQVIKRNRPVSQTEFGVRFTRGHPRQRRQKLWLPYSESRAHTDWHSFLEPLPDDHVLITHPVSELWEETHNTSLQIFPQHTETQPRHGLHLTRDNGRNSPLNGYYLTDYGVIQVAYGRINRLMPYDAINLQVHEFNAKLVWKAGAADRLDLTQYVFELERSFTVGDWETAARNPEQFISDIKHSFIEHSGGHWTKEHDLMLTDVLKDTTGNHVKWAVESIQRGMEPHNKTLATAINNLYTFKQSETPRWSSYDEFLNSPEWQAKRREVINRSGGYCESCGIAGIRTPAAHVHHVHYKKPWGQEDPTDLLHLCEAHHKLAHGNTRPS